jgi:microcystin degradation protein MlrC
MRIAVAGFMHESNTFSPLKADRAAFAAQGLAFGPALLKEWAEAHHEVGGFLAGVRAGRDEVVPLVMAWATPSGPVTDAVFDEITGRLLDARSRSTCTATCRSG